jgi:predicted O-methyltransferase YrrM
MYINSDIESSYQENDLGHTLYDLVLVNKPLKIIEFGVLYGYSTIAMAQALKVVGKGKIDAYDLWTKYSYKHSTLSDTQANINNYGLTEYVNLLYGDFDSWVPEPFDLMHIDISNTGETIEKAYEKLKSYLAQGSIVVFEGGTLERDNVEWMKVFKKKPIRKTNINYKVINPDFPGLSQILK